MLHSYESYSAMPALIVPFKVKTLTVDTLEILCPTCRMPITDLRGKVGWLGRCYYFDAAGLCVPCHSVVSFRLRWYPKEKRAIAAFKDGTWKEVYQARGFRAWLDGLRGKRFLKGSSRQ